MRNKEQIKGKKKGCLGLGMIVGVGGKKRHGKDTFANNLPGDWVKLEMSTPVFEGVLGLDPYLRDGRRVSEALEDAGGLQVFGTDVGRKMFGEDVWVRIMVQKAEALLAAGRNVVVTGIRFPNELAAIEGLGGVTVWVSRPGFSEDTDSNADHVSENALTPEDFEVLVETPHLGELVNAAHDFSVKQGTFTPKS